MSVEPELEVARVPASGAASFVHRSNDAHEHLADVTWPAPEYEYDHVELPLALVAPGHAVAWAERALPASRLTAAETDDILVLISELVADAVQHACRDGAETVTIRLAASSDCIRIEVSDRGTAAAPAEDMDMAAYGSGLHVVDALATRWGTARCDRHCVWLERER